MELAEFLLARITEDEDDAREANGRVAWLTLRESDGSMRYTTVAHQLPDVGDHWVADGHEIDSQWAYVFYDSARVLAECEAKRRIVNEHGGAGGLCDVCAEYDGAELMPQRYPCPTLRLLALPYADHPDYREEWHQGPASKSSQVG